MQDTTLSVRGFNLKVEDRVVNTDGLSYEDRKALRSSLLAYIRRTNERIGVVCVNLDIFAYFKGRHDDYVIPSVDLDTWFSKSLKKRKKQMQRYKRRPT